MIKHLLSSQHGNCPPLAVVVMTVFLAGCAGFSDDRMAARAYERGEMTQAREAYLRKLQRDPADAQAWFRLGNAYVEEARLREAEDAFRRTLELEPEHHRARHNLGLVHLQQGVSALLEARRELPAVDEQAEATMRYLACLMETFMGHPRPPTCRDAAEE